LLQAPLTARTQAAPLGRQPRRRLALQRFLGWLLGPLWIPLVAAALRFGLRYRVDDLGEVRRQYRRLSQRSEGPLLLCANHLTMIDSAILAWALASPVWYLRHYSSLPWNMPERRNFAFSWPAAVLAYVMKCLPVTRGGPREEVVQTLADFVSLLGRGDVGLLFPEGGRSRTGRVEMESASYGVGRVVRALPGCRVLCVYLRGRQQEGFSRLPARGDRFHVELTLIEPRSDAPGLRAERDIARQIIGHLMGMEQRYFHGRE